MQTSNQPTSDTPKTDAAKRRINGMADEWVPRYVSEQLERELDQWVAKAAELSAERESNAMQALAYKAERDEARAQLREERQLHSQTLDERDEARESLAAAEAWSATLADVGEDFRAANAELRAAIRNMRDVQGRYHTQIATERLFALLPESSQPKDEAVQRPAGCGCAAGEWGNSMKIPAVCAEHQGDICQNCTCCEHDFECHANSLVE